MLKFNHIRKIGVECEGCFDRTVVDNEPSAERETSGIKGESMTLSEEERAIVTTKNLVVGERNSPPYEDPKKLRNWLKTFFPVLNNASNGFHIHVSFKNDDHRVKVIASKEFHDDFLAAAKAFVSKEKYKFSTPMLDRVIRGMNQYARHDHNPGARGAVHALSHWKTCEFRIFSGALNLTQAKRCITFITTFVEEYLEDHCTREKVKDIGVEYKAFDGTVISS